MATKAKFDKKKCIKCIYHGVGKCGHCVRMPDGHTERVHCNYSSVTDVTCLQPGPNGTVIDMRGEDYNNCLLFVEGKRVEGKQQPLVMGVKRHEYY